MYKLFFGVLLFITSTSFSQDSLESFSIYFKTNECKPYELGSSINDKTWGTYELEALKSNQMRLTVGDNIVIDENGIYILKNKLLNISREEVRENSKYHVKNGFLHGILANDSLPTFLQDDSYYFLLPTKNFLYDKKNKTQTLYKSGPNSYYVFSLEDNNYYSVLSVCITNGLLSLAELNLSYTAVNSITHTITSENDIKTFIINPSNLEWNNILVKAFVIYDSYKIGK